MRGCAVTNEEMRAVLDQIEDVLDEMKLADISESAGARLYEITERARAKLDADATEQHG